jgi:two-component system LytT family response regulator
MLRIVAVDDEIKALDRFGRLIKEEENITLIGSFTKPQEALEFIKNQEVDVVFLDIEMPQINGLELSEAIFELKPEIDVVFITAYDKYALEAFQVHAIGYLLKPIDLEDIKKQVANIMKRRLARPKEKKSEKLFVECLGQFSCFLEGNKNEKVKWRTSKAEELFAFLIHYQGKPVSKDKIIDTLWTEMSIEKASKNLHATCYYIRDVLSEKGLEDLFLRSKGSYQIKIEKLQCDLFSFIEAIEDISKGKFTLQRLEEASGLYKGDYFDDKHYGWSANTRFWLEDRHEKLQLKLAEGYIKSNEIGKAKEILNNIIIHNSLADDGYKMSIELCLAQGDKASAVMYYKKYEKILQEELGIIPPDYIKRIIEEV